jgi:hypothetical protein
VHAFRRFLPSQKAQDSSVSSVTHLCARIQTMSGFHANNTMSFQPRGATHRCPARHCLAWKKMRRWLDGGPQRTFAFVVHDVATAALDTVRAIQFRLETRRRLALKVSMVASLSGEARTGAAVLNWRSAHRGTKLRFCPESAVSIGVLSQNRIARDGRDQLGRLPSRMPSVPVPSQCSVPRS